MGGYGKGLLASAAVIACAAVVAACGSSNDDTAKGSKASSLKGTVTADGSSTVFPISQALAEEFRKENGDVEVSVGSSGTGGGFEKFCRGETDISNASRPIEDEEKALCEKGGVQYQELTIATDGLTIVVNPKNDYVDCLTIEQLKKIWAPKSKVKTWADVDPTWPKDPIALYGPGTASGTFDYFTETVVGEKGASRTDYTASEDDNVLVQGVAGDEGGLGYFGYGYYEENTDKLKAVGIDAGKGCVEPTDETIDSGAYAPLSRPLFIYVSKKALASEPVKAYVQYTLDNVSDMVGDVGFIKAPDAKIDASKAAWTEFTKSA